MAKNTGRGSHAGSVTGRGQAKNGSGTWIKRDTTTGRLLKAKADGGSFKGVRREK